MALCGSEGRGGLAAGAAGRYPFADQLAIDARRRRGTFAAGAVTRRDHALNAEDVRRGTWQIRGAHEDGVRSFR